jgi:uncharacterized protein (DUF3084 family)
MTTNMESTLAALQSSLKTMKPEYDSVRSRRSTLSCEKMYNWNPPKFDDVVNAFRKDPVAALSKYSEIQAEQRRKQAELDTLTARYAELESQKNTLEREIRETRTAIRQAEKDTAMAPYVEQYKDWDCKRLRKHAETMYQKLGSAMTNSAAGNKFGWGHDPSNPTIQKLDLELDAIAKVMLTHCVQVSYKDNKIVFTDTNPGELADKKRRRN